MYEIIFSNTYEKRAKKFFKKHPDLLERYIKILKILEYDPHHPSLRLHKLEGKLSNLYSISINMSYRITLELIIENKKIILINIGSHQEVY
ncbi:type II toxin-antitoxin system RelE/ParE family toxin [Marinitoga lauensis]|uniref:type II toxin-antitoxin system RelE/ParE family toxin n=1 Tax=Marinitoga lauensis TaxID=2201189 RepID=UPI001013039D|nr:type II toxin-antitoxin system RelE/ParE family toxin [Marinitoga lauensis]